MVQLKISPLEKEISFEDHHFQVNRFELEVYGGVSGTKSANSNG